MIAVEVADALNGPPGNSQPAYRGCRFLDGGSVHFPDVQLPGFAVLPEDVSVAVAVEVSDALNAPIEGGAAGAAARGVVDNAVRS